MGRGNEYRDRRRQSGAQPDEPWGDYAPPPLFLERPSRLPAAPPVGREAEARVIWFNPEKGFGFVELSDGTGEAFLHIRQVEVAGHRAVEPGTTMVIRVGPGQKGPQVTEIVRIDSGAAEQQPSRLEPRGRPSLLGISPGIARAQSMSGPPDVAGTVKWYDPGKGFGFVFVEGEHKDLFVHVSVVERAGLSTLEKGQPVRVSIVEGRKGREVGAIELA